MNKYRQFIITQGEKYIRKLEALFAQYSLVGNPTFFDCQNFDWVSKLEKHWKIIRQELDGVLQNLDKVPNFQDLSPDQYDVTSDNRWKTFFFYAYGLKANNNCEKCPQTTKLIEEIPGIKTAFFFHSFTP